MPTIAIDYTPAHEQGAGIGRYVRQLVLALSRLDTETQYRLFVSGAKLGTLPAPPGQNFEWRSTQLSPRWLARLWHRAHISLPVEFWTGPIDLYHATDFVLPPTRKHTRTLLTVHDLSFLRVPEAAEPSLRAYLERVVPYSVAKSDHVLADSFATRDDLIDFYHVNEEKISVLYSGVDTNRFDDGLSNKGTLDKEFDLPRPYILAVGTIQPRKNYARLIFSLALLRESGYDVDLAIVGGRGWLTDSVNAALYETGLQEHVHFLGFVADKDLSILYRDAICLAFPSLYEGFGLPILEAMACGTPVVTANISSMPEVAGDAALLVDPYDVEALADAIQQLVEDSSLRADLTKRGHERIKDFTWKGSARQLRQIYTELLKRIP